MKYLTNLHNYECYTGTFEHGQSKVFYETQLANKIAAAGIKKKSSARDVKNFIQRKVDSWKRADEWVNNMGEGLKDEGKDVEFKDVVLKMCSHYYDMEDILSTHAGVRPILDSDMAHVDNDFLTATAETNDGGRDSSGGEEGSNHLGVEAESDCRRIESEKKRSLQEFDRSMPGLQDRAGEDSSSSEGSSMSPLVPRGQVDFSSDKDTESVTEDRIYDDGEP